MPQNYRKGLVQTLMTVVFVAVLTFGLTYVIGLAFSKVLPEEIMFALAGAGFVGIIWFVANTLLAILTMNSTKRRIRRKW